MSYLDEHRDEIFKKYSKEELLRDIGNYKSGSGKLSKVLNYFFEEIIWECTGPRGNKSPMEALSDDEMMGKILEYVNSKPSFYTGNEISNVKSFFRNGGKWACKVANFCPKNARDIYFRYYDINGSKINILDTSSGFGSRMSAALLSGKGHNYAGFDPNEKLSLKLKEYRDFLSENNLTEGKAVLLCEGSETYIPKLENNFDVSFTSPPYFNLEVYSKDEKQSIQQFSNYELWLEKFARPTIENTYKYLKVGGYAMINIKNLTRSKKEPLFDDWFKIFESIDGFEFHEIFEMEHQSKKNYTMNTNYSKEAYQGFKEPIMCFKKIR